VIPAGGISEFFAAKREHNTGKSMETSIMMESEVKNYSLKRKIDRFIY